MGTIMRIREVAARKEYRCCRCGAIIFKGQRHQVVDTRFKYELRSDRRHSVCPVSVEINAELLNGHIFGHVMKAFIRSVRGFIDDAPAPKYVERLGWWENDPWADFAEMGEVELDREIEEFENDPNLRHVYGHEEPD